MYQIPIMGTPSLVLSLLRSFIVHYCTHLEEFGASVQKYAECSVYVPVDINNMHVHVQCTCSEGTCTMFMLIKCMI